MIKTIIRVPNHLGDTLMAQGAIRAFVEWTPDSETYLLLPQWAEPIYKSISYIKLLSLAGNHLHGLSAVMHQVKTIFGEKFGVGIVLTPSFSSALVLSLAGVKSRYGYDGEGRGIFLNNKIPGDNISQIHRSERYLRLLEHTAGHKLVTKMPALFISESSMEEAYELLKGRSINPEHGFITLAPQAVAESRRWGSENYSELANKIDMPVVLVGTANEYRAGQQIAEGNDQVVNLCGETNIETAGAILSAARAFVGNDSGLAHLAAAVDTPLVVLSGADRPSETSPISDNKIVIIKEHLECISCVKNVCPLKGEAFMQCMKQIRVDEVYETVVKLL